MSILTAPAPTPNAARSSRLMRWRRRLVVLALVALGLGILITVALARTAPADDLDPESPDAVGALALVTVLREHGVDVQVTRNLADTRSAVADAHQPTTLMVVPSRYQPSDALSQLADAASPALQRIVVVAPDAALLTDAGIDVQSLPGRAPLAEASCTSPLVHPGDQIEASTAVRLVVPENAADTTSCYPVPGSDPDAPASGQAHGVGLVTTPLPSHADVELVLFAAPQAWSNQSIAQAAHAGLALRSLGHSPHLVWYQSGPDDLSADGSTSSSVWPAWLGPATALIAAGWVFYAIAVGRRLGPLVTEPLPVVVPAAETTTSRGRLYRRTGDRARSARLLRDATRARLATRLAVPRTAPPDVLVAAVAGALGRPVAEVGGILYGPDPTTDSDLITLARQLTDLEEGTRR